MKKIFVLFLAMMFVFPVCHASADYTEYINDGKMTLSGTCDEAVLGDVITLSVVSSDVDWQNLESWITIADNMSAIGYYDETKADANGGYKFNYYLSDQGEYTLYIGSKHFLQAKKEKLVYINADKNKAAIEDLNSALDAATIEQLLKDGKYSFGVYSKLYDKVNLANAAQILFDYYSKDGKKTSGYADTQSTDGRIYVFRITYELWCNQSKI